LTISQETFFMITFFRDKLFSKNVTAMRSIHYVLQEN
jgi:hypothetical protein